MALFKVRLTIVILERSDVVLCIVLWGNFSVGHVLFKFLVKNWLLNVVSFYHLICLLVYNILFSKLIGLRWGLLLVHRMNHHLRTKIRALGWYMISRGKQIKLCLNKVAIVLLYLKVLDIWKLILELTMVNTAFFLLFSDDLKVFCHFAISLHLQLDVSLLILIDLFHLLLVRCMVDLLLETILKLLFKRLELMNSLLTLNVLLFPVGVTRHLVILVSHFWDGHGWLAVNPFTLNVVIIFVLHYHLSWWELRIGDESEAPGLLSALILQDDAILELAKVLKVVSEVFKRQIVGKSSNEDLSILGIGVVNLFLFRQLW